MNTGSSHPGERESAIWARFAVLVGMGGLAVASVAQADIALTVGGGGSALRGGNVSVTVSVQGDERDIAGVDIDLWLDANVFAPHDPKDPEEPQDCVPAGRLAGIAEVFGYLDDPAPEPGKRRMSLSITQPIAIPPADPVPLGDGALIMCSFAVRSDAPLGDTEIRADTSRSGAYDFDAEPLLPLSIVEAATVSVVEQLPTATPTATPTTKAGGHGGGGGGCAVGPSDVTGANGFLFLAAVPFLLILRRRSIV